MAKKKNAPPIGFGRSPLDNDDDPTDGGARHDPNERPLEPPLAEPIFVDTVVMYEILKRYNLHPLVPLGTMELQLVQVIAGLEKRVRELSPY